MDEKLPALIRQADIAFTFDMDRELVYEATGDGLPYRFLFAPRGKGLPLIVICPSELPREADAASKFQRIDWARRLPYNTLIFQDPTLSLKADLRSGWGLGTAEEWALAGIAQVVGRLRDQLGIADRNIVFVGAAAGGFCALVLAAQFARSSCLANNPDTNLLEVRRESVRGVLAAGYGPQLATIKQTHPERFSVLKALELAGPRGPHIYCLKNTLDGERRSDAFSSFVSAMTARAANSDAADASRFVVDYYFDPRGAARNATAGKLSGALEHMAPWFASEQGRARAAARVAAKAAAVELPPAALQPSNEQKARWAELLPTEIAYWEQVISGTHPNPERTAGFRKRAAGQLPVPGPIVKFLERLDLSRAKILDVGAGPHSTIGPVLHSTVLNITAVDPLAEAYAEILARNGIVPAIPTQKGEGETLSAQFGRNRFDIVYSRNALDHSYAPLTAIQQMVEVCVPGGVVHIEGSINEGLKQNYGGLHQWNFLPVEDDLVVWNAQGAHLAGRTLTDVAYMKSESRASGWFSATLVKTS